MRWAPLASGAHLIELDGVLSDTYELFSSLDELDSAEAQGVVLDVEMLWFCREDLFLRLHVEDCHGAIVAAGGDESRVWAEAQIIDAVFLDFDVAQKLSCLELPCLEGPMAMGPSRHGSSRQESF